MANNLIDIYRTFHHQQLHYFPNEHGALIKLEHVLGHKTTLHKFRRSTITSTMFAIYNGNKFEINNRHIDVIYST